MTIILQKKSQVKHFLKLCAQLILFVVKQTFVSGFVKLQKTVTFPTLKKQQRVVDIDSLELTDDKDSVEEQILNQSDVMRIHHLLHNLTEPYKEVFMLRVFGELSFKQIAEIFQKTDNWACVTYHRARNKILEQMEANNE